MSTMRNNGPYAGFQSVDFDLKSDISVGILFFISVSLLASGFIVKPKYSKMPTCFILSSLQRMLCIGMSHSFEITMHTILFAFS